MTYQKEIRLKKNIKARFDFYYEHEYESVEESKINKKKGLHQT